MTLKIKRIIILAVFTAVLSVLVIWTAHGNKALELNTYTLTANDLPDAFDGYRIAHVSDLHNTEIGENNEKLISMLRDSQPDIIAITGDMIDSRNTDVPVALQFAREAVKIAPCYYVPGNHEGRVYEYDELKKALTELGVTVLGNEQVALERSGKSISLLGAVDPSFYTDYIFGDDRAVMDSVLKGFDYKEDAFTVLLSHRPELFDIYAENDIDLVLSGHAHGGQFRLPFVGGLAAPNQGLFPAYDGGIYTQDNTNMVVSRGIGNSIIPFRFNNPPEVILIELKAE